MKISMVLLSTFVVALLETRPIDSFGLSPKDRPVTPSSTTSSSSRPESTMSRTAFVGTLMGGMMMIGTQDAWAKDTEVLKGTKKDPSFEQCLSTCMYECTKPKGAEQKSRAVCLPECKTECATSKAQLLKGEPKDNEQTEEITIKSVQE